LVAQGARFIRSDFLSAARQLTEEGVKFDMILADLGVSSPQLDRAERGFSFGKSGPLDMRMDQRQQLTASDIVNRYPEEELRRIIREYGEEPKAKFIAQAIVAHRPLQTTGELAEVIAQAIHGRKGRIHPATRTFQALRIELNQELEQVKQFLPLVPHLLKPGGRVAIISFHSLEDRIVKKFFAEQAQSGYEAELQILTKKPIEGATDDVNNPRARSAKLRAAAKIKKERDLKNANQGS
jgi:16S rRNA (cytosine1402-N4)-methyltransferase